MSRSSVWSSLHPRIVICVASALMLAGVLACSEKIVGNRASSPGNIRIETKLAPSEAAAIGISFYRITISGPDMTTIRDTLHLVDQTGTLVGSAAIPFGINRTFVIEAMLITRSAVGNLAFPDTIAVYRGEAVTDVVPGADLNLSVLLVPVVPMLRVAPRFVKATAGVSFEVSVQAYNIDSLAQISGSLEVQDVLGTFYYPVDSLIQPPDVDSSLQLSRDGNYFAYWQNQNGAPWVPVLRSGNSGTLVQAVMTIPVDTTFQKLVDTLNLFLQINSMNKLNGDTISLSSVYMGDALVELHR
jgi:hypothetical protein